MHELALEWILVAVYTMLRWRVKADLLRSTAKKKKHNVHKHAELCASSFTSLDAVYMDPLLAATKVRRLEVQSVTWGTVLVKQVTTNPATR